MRLHDGNGKSLQVRPVWDPDRKELRVGDKVVKTFRQPALNQEAVLATFQDDEWPARIDDPLPPQPGTKPKERLKFTIRGLNRFHEQKGIISFRGDGTGEGVVWYFAADFQAARARHAGPATRRQ